MALPTAMSPPCCPTAIKPRVSCPIGLFSWNIATQLSKSSLLIRYSANAFSRSEPLVMAKMVRKHGYIYWRFFSGAIFVFTVWKCILLYFDRASCQHETRALTRSAPPPPLSTYCGDSAPSQPSPPTRHPVSWSENKIIYIDYRKLIYY